jgi:hypothetical protein
VIWSAVPFCSRGVSPNPGFLVQLVLVVIDKSLFLDRSVDESARKVHRPLKSNERILTRWRSYGFICTAQLIGRPRRTVVSLGCPLSSFSVKLRSAITSPGEIEFCICALLLPPY